MDRARDSDSYRDGARIAHKKLSKKKTTEVRELSTSREVRRTTPSARNENGAVTMCSPNESRPHKTQQHSSFFAVAAHNTPEKLSLRHSDTYAVHA